MWAVRFNTMYKKIITIVALAIIVSPFTNLAANTKGKLVYDSGRSINYYDFDTGVSGVMLEKDRLSVSPGGITKIDNSYIVYGLQKPNGKYDLVLYEYKKNQQVVLGAGSYPLYLKEKKELMYFDSAKNGRGLWLYKAQIYENELVKTEPIVTELPFYSANPLYKVNENNVVFIDSENKSWKLNLDNNQLEPIESLNTNNCIMYLWISKTQQYLCREQSTGYLYLVNSNTGDRTLFIDKLKYVTAYIKELDSIIYTIPGFSFIRGETYEIGRYNLINQKKMKLPAVGVTTPGNVIWVE